MFSRYGVSLVGIHQDVAWHNWPSWVVIFFFVFSRYGVSLVGIQQDVPGSTIQLNPGPRHIMKCTDLCFYMSVTKEENSAFILAHPNDEKDNRLDKMKPPAGGNYSKIASMIASVGELFYPLCCWWLIWPMQNDAKKWKMTETLAHRYLSESAQWELSHEYQHDRV